MDGNKPMQSQIKKSQLANELIYRKYLFGNDNFRGHFKDLQIMEYVFLHAIIENEKSAAIYSGRTYLQELADKMQMPIRQTSRMIRELRDKGLVDWSHDGDGSEGTYVTITQEGMTRFHRQEEGMTRFFGTVIEKFGQENLMQLLRLMKEFGTVLSAELEKKEGVRNE